jgi:hypothetical protein
MAKRKDVVPVKNKPSSTGSIEGESGVGEDNGRREAGDYRRQGAQGRG